MAEVRRNRRFKQEVNTPEGAGDWQTVTANYTRAAIRVLAPKDTGFLKQRILAEPSTRTASVRFKSTVGEPPYDLYQEVGTGLYGPLRRWITPKRAQFLSWIASPRGTRFFAQSNRRIFGEGRRVFARRVRGTRPKHYFKRALERLFGEANVNYYGDTGGRPPQKG